MPKNYDEASLPKDALGILDDLIRRYYERLLVKLDVNLKPGDLIKMIELRHKLAPTTAEQEKFWAMLSQIRRDKLKNTTENSQSKKETVSK